MKILDKQLLKSINNEAKLTPELFIEAANIIANDIEKIVSENRIDKNDIQMIGVARGGLPLMVAVSHRTGIRCCSSVQFQMNKSDNKNDYGETHYINGEINKDKKYYFVFEDIIYKGNTINLLFNMLGKQKDKVLSIYSLVIDKNFKRDKVFKYDEDLIKPCYQITADDWVYFFWEKGYIK